MKTGALTTPDDAFDGKAIETFEVFDWTMLGRKKFDGGRQVCTKEFLILQKPIVSSLFSN